MPARLRNHACSAPLIFNVLEIFIQGNESHCFPPLVSVSPFFLFHSRVYFSFTFPFHSRRKRVARAKFNSGTLVPSPRLRLPTIYNDTELVHSRIRIVSFGIVADTACNISVKYRPIHGALYNITFRCNYDGILPNGQMRYCYSLTVT